MRWVSHLRCFRTDALACTGSTPTRQHFRQLKQAVDLGVGLSVRFPGLALGVVPDGAQAGLLGAEDIVAGVVTHVYGGVSLGITALEGFQERRRVGFADAQV